MSLPRFYPIFPDAGWLARMLPLGIRFAQLRVKTGDIRGEIHQGLAIARRYGAALVINDHWQAAIEAGAEWLHLGQEDLDGADLPAIRRAGLRLGISTHDHAELARALALAPDYVALGPVYATKLKQMKWAPQGLARVAEWKRLVGDTPLCAIGGLTAERAPGVLAVGADLVSVVTDICAAPVPEARARVWMDVLG